MSCPQCPIVNVLDTVVISGEYVVVWFLALWLVCLCLVSCQAGLDSNPGPSALKASDLPIEITWQISITIKN